MRFLTFIFFIVIILITACQPLNDDGSTQKKDNKYSGLKLAETNLLDFSSDCNVLDDQELWKPSSTFEKTNIDSSKVDFKISKKAMDKLDEYEYFFTTSESRLKFFKTAVSPPFHLEIDFEELKVNKACVQLVDKKWILPDPQKKDYPIVIMTLFGENIPYGSLRIFIDSEYSYYKQIRNGRYIGVLSGFYLDDMDNVRKMFSEKNNNLNSKQKDNINYYLKIMGFSPGKVELERHFFNFVYRYVTHSILGTRYGLYFEDDIFVSRTSLKKMQLRQTTHGSDAIWDKVPLDYLESEFSIIGLMMKFYNRFSYIHYYWYKTKIEGVDDLPEGNLQTEAWHFYYFLLNSIPSFDYLIIEKCIEDHKMPHEKLYCQLLKKQMESENKNYEDFLKKKYFDKSSLQGLGGFLSAKGRRFVIDRYLELSEKVISEIWKLKRQKIKSDIDFNQNGLQVAAELKEDISAIMPIIISMKIAQAQAKGFGFVGQFFKKEITQAEMKERMDKLNKDTKSEALTIIEEISKLQKGAIGEVEETEEIFRANANQADPFDNPYNHMVW